MTRVEIVQANNIRSDLVKAREQCRMQSAQVRIRL
jgi:hypothetical protein